MTPLAIDDVTEFFRQVDGRGIRPVSVGGDHAVLIGILRGIAGSGSRVGGPIGLVHFAAAAKDGRLIHREKRYGDIGRSEVRRLSVIEALTMLLELAA